MRKWTLLCILLLLMLVSGCQTNKEQEKETVGGVTVTSTPTPAVTPTPEPTITPTPVITLSVPVTYRPVEPKAEGLTEIQCSEGEGIELDLNGDGAPEQIYTAEEGIYINGILQEQDFRWKFYYRPFDPDYRQMWETYWIVDVDKEDKYYNLIFFTELGSHGEEVLTYYSDILHDIAYLEARGGAFTNAEYYGNGIFLAKNRPWGPLFQYLTGITYRLDEEGGITRVGDYIPLSTPYVFELVEIIDMYLEDNLESPTKRVEAQTVQMLGSSRDWVKFRLEDGTEAWIYVEYVQGTGSVVNHGKTAQELFSGMPYEE
ncbi:MAG: hypothetical protein J6J42_10180 [Lachnospiraceae bacterium]|nr:hypothetical protein [Lachnospiraceae bacterium]